MPWFNSKVYNKTEVTEASESLPCNHQVGSNVWLHIFDENNEWLKAIDAVVAGVTISGMHQITYDLFFKVDSDVFVRVNGFRGFITSVGQYMDCDGGLVDAKTFNRIKKTKLEVVK